MYIYAYYTYVGKKSLSDNSSARAHEDISLVIYCTTAVVVIYNPTSVELYKHRKHLFGLDDISSEQMFS